MEIFAYVAVLLISAVVAMALAPKPKPPTAAALNDFQAPTAEEGRAVPVIFGDVWVTGPNVVWFGDLRVSPIKKKGGKK
jgi:hypothetical protein